MDSARDDFGGSTQPRHACGFLVDTYRKQCLGVDFGNAREILPPLAEIRFCFGYGSLLIKRIILVQEIGVSTATQAAKTKKWVIYGNQMFQKKRRDLDSLKSRGGVLTRD